MPMWVGQNGKDKRVVVAKMDLMSNVQAALYITNTELRELYFATQKKLIELGELSADNPART